MKKLVVVNDLNEWPLPDCGVELVTAKSYLADECYAALKRTRVFNLCRSYRYQSLGYYVSLLAEARGHRPVPSATNIQDFKSKALVRTLSGEIDELIQRALAPLKTDTFTLSVYFGRNVAKRYHKLARELYQIFTFPMMRAQFVRQKQWQLKEILPIGFDQVPESHRDCLREFAAAYFSRWRHAAKSESPHYRYDLAILANPHEENPPSDKEALQKFSAAASSLGFQVETIGRDQFYRLLEFDALFIRETTGVNHHTYQFARRAEAEGMVVIDDPDSILKCTNKVYLAEILRRARIPTPRTTIVNRDNIDSVRQSIPLPCVLKQPDGAFSRGVIKLEQRDALQQELELMLRRSALVLAQEFVPTEFDWRIGVLDRQPLFACRYFMARGHWQIYNWGSEQDQVGNYETVPLAAVPREVIETAVKAANLVGDGLYGVDLKQLPDAVVVIEINDNPNIDSEVEDAVLGDLIYQRVMLSMLRRLDERRAAR